MQNPTNPCTRCGKQRITKSTVQETIGTALITRTETICPDPDCQEKVEKQLEVEKEKRLQMTSFANNRRPATRH